MADPSPQVTAVGVFLAGGAGALLRVMLSASVEQHLGERLPQVGVLSANLLGCLLIGACAAAIPDGQARTIVLGGLLGGFTTYSAFALFQVDLLAQGRLAALALQLGAHLFGGFLAVVLGIWIARTVGLAPVTP